MRSRPATRGSSRSCCPSAARSRVRSSCSRTSARRGIIHGIATSGSRPEINSSLAALGVPDDMVVIDRTASRAREARARPVPRRRRRARASHPDECYVVGDAVWDLLAARRAKMLSIGLLSGGYGTDELLSAGAFRVYADAAELHRSLDELGFDA